MPTYSGASCKAALPTRVVCQALKSQQSHGVEHRFCSEGEKCFVRTYHCGVECKLRIDYKIKQDAS